MISLIALGILALANMLYSVYILTTLRGQEAKLLHAIQRLSAVPTDDIYIPAQQTLIKSKKNSTITDINKTEMRAQFLSDL